jgi:magnesium transporter
LIFLDVTINQEAIISVVFPIAAGVSGSAATQTLTVTVRGLALGEISPKEGFKALGRELLLGLVNGIIIGVIVALIALVWKGTPLLGLVVGASTLLNMICAGLAGVVVPMAMHKLKFDPALASPILVTTITDSTGYFAYLGLATLLIAFLV